MTEKPRIVKMKGDLAKTMEDGTRIFIEIEIGNEASVFRDIVKLMLRINLKHLIFLFSFYQGRRQQID